MFLIGKLSNVIVVILIVVVLFVLIEKGLIRLDCYNVLVYFVLLSFEKFFKFALMSSIRVY